MTRRNRQSTAFSLFAFQDIITSVTGVMILVTLLLALELIQRKEGSPAHQTEVVTTAMKKAVRSTEELENTIDDNTQRINELRERLARKQDGLKEVSAYDVDQLKSRLADIEEINDRLDNEADKTEQQRKAAAKRRKQMEGDVKRAAEAATNAKTARQEIIKIKKQLEDLKRSNRVVYSVASDNSKKAWLVQISQEGIRVAPAKKSQPAQNLANPDAFFQWCKARSPDQEYFVLLVKPSGIPFYREVTNGLEQRRFDVGYDVITEDQTAVDDQAGAGVP